MSLDDIRMLVLDVDGVLTDGKIVFTESGELIKAFHVQDGTGIKFWHRAGRQSAVISGRESSTVERRCRELGIEHVYQGMKDKTPALESLLARTKLDLRELAYVGDDLVDLPIMHRVGFPVAVANARPEVREAARYVTRARGGEGAVREVVELLLRRQGLWDGIMTRYRTGNES